MQPEKTMALLPLQDYVTSCRFFSSFRSQKTWWAGVCRPLWREQLVQLWAGPYAAAFTSWQHLLQIRGKLNLLHRLRAEPSAHIAHKLRLRSSIMFSASPMKKVLTDISLPAKCLFPLVCLFILSFIVFIPFLVSLFELFTFFIPDPSPHMNVCVHRWGF